jgi:HlyD family secretion protein
MTRRNIEPGQVIAPGTLLFEIDDPDRLQLTADLLVQDAARIKPGILVRAFDEDAGITVTGTVAKIDPKAFSKLSDLGIEQKRIRVEITPDPGTVPLRMGMELDMEVVEAQKEEVLMLPDSSVFKINEKSHVFVVAGDTARLTPVEVGLEGKNAVEILSGLKLGDLVIDAPGNDLKDGAKVKEEE